jgi:hypothetical protein
MRLNEIESKPESKLDIDNKVYIVYDENGQEYSRHPFKEVWDSSPARNAATNDVRNLISKLRIARDNQSKKDIEAKPLSKLEQEYIVIHSKWQKYFDAMFSKDPSKRLPDLDDETKQVYTDQMDKWMARLDQIGQVVRKSIINGTYKPS